MMIRAAMLARGGASKEEIVDEVSKYRQTYEDHRATGLRRQWEIDKDYKTMIRHFGKLAGAGVSARVPGIDLADAGEAFADGFMIGYENYVLDDRVRAASRALGQEFYTLEHSEARVARLIQSTYENNDTFRKVYAEQFTPTIGFKPTASLEDIRSAYPEFAANAGVEQVMGILTNADGAVKVALTDAERSALLDFWRSNLSDFRQDNTQRLNTLAQKGELMTNLMEQQQLDETRRQQELFERENDRLRMEGLRSGAYLAGVAIGFIDPELGQQVNAVTGAAFEINRSIEAYQAAMELGSDISGSASLVMTGNFVAVGLSLMNAFSDRGPSPEQMILDELRLVRQQIADVRKEMHERFDIVDEKLDQIYQRLDEGFADLEYQLSGNRRALSQIRSALKRLQRSQFSSSFFAVDQNDLVIAYLKAFELAPCLERKLTVAVVLSPSEYADCVVRLQSVFDAELLGKTQAALTEANDDAHVTELFYTRPHKAANISYQTFLGLTGQTLLRGDMVDPLQWVNAGNAYLDFLNDWPIHRDLVLLERFDELNIEGQRISAFSDAIDRDMRAFLAGSDEATPSQSAAFATLIDNTIIPLSEQLSDRVADLEESYYRQIRVSANIGLRGLLNEMKPEPVSAQPMPEYCRQPIAADMVPEGLDRLLPEYVKQAVSLGLGEIRFCLTFRYDQPTTTVNIPGEELIVDSGPGPYMAEMRLRFVRDGMQCERISGVHNGMNFFYGSITDASKMAGGYNQPAPRPNLNIWYNEWRAKFTDVYLSTNPQASEVDASNELCLRQALKGPIEAAFAEQKRELSNYIIENIRSDEETDQLDLGLSRTYAQIAHWIWFSYSDAAFSSDLVSSIIAGQTRGPSIAETLAYLDRTAGFGWTIPEIVASRSEAYLAALTHPEMHRLVNSYSGNFGVRQVIDRIP